MAEMVRAPCGQLNLQHIKNIIKWAWHDTIVTSFNNVSILREIHVIQKVLEGLVQASPSHPYTSFIVVKILYINQYTV